MESATVSSLLILRRQYFQLVEPPHLRWPDAQTLKSPEVQSWIYHNFFNRDENPHPPPDHYQQRVLKVLTSMIESAIDDPEEDEISDDLMTTLSCLFGSGLPSESTSAQQKAYVTYTYPPPSAGNSTTGELTVTLLESRSVISSSGTTGLRTWEAALLLGSFLVSEAGKRIVEGKRVLELGAGTGMLSILCAKHLDVSSILATDGDEAVVDAINTNAFLNEELLEPGTSRMIHSAALKWGYPIQGATFAEDYGMDVPDVVLGADVTYDRGVIPTLVSTLRDFFDLNTRLQVLIAATIRNEQTFETFLNACRRNRFGVELVDFTPIPEHLQEGPFYPTQTPIQIWRITRPQAPKDPFAF